MQVRFSLYTQKTLQTRKQLVFQQRQMQMYDHSAGNNDKKKQKTRYWKKNKVLRNTSYIPKFAVLAPHFVITYYRWNIVLENKQQYRRCGFPLRKWNQNIYFIFWKWHRSSRLLKTFIQILVCFPWYFYCVFFAIDSKCFEKIYWIRKV